MDHDTRSESIIARIQLLSDRLTPTEQRLVAALVAAPREIALATASDFAAQAGAHEATISRFARKLGFDSYAAFRDALQAEYVHGADPAQRVAATLGASGGQILDNLLRAEIEALMRIPGFVDQGQIDRAAALIDRPRLFIFAQGNATVLAGLVARRLRRMGRQAILLTGGPRDLAETLVGLRSDDAVLAFAFRRQPRQFAALIETAREAGAAVVAVSDTLGPALSPVPDLLLTAPRGGGEGMFQTLSVPMLICNALILGLSARHEQLDGLERLGRLIRRFEG